FLPPTVRQKSCELIAMVLGEPSANTASSCANKFWPNINPPSRPSRVSLETPSPYKTPSVEETIVPPCLVSIRKLALKFLYISELLIPPDQSGLKLATLTVLPALIKGIP